MPRARDMGRGGEVVIAGDSGCGPGEVREGGEDVSTKKQRLNDPAKCLHGEQPDMGYVQWHEDADRRIKAGQKQRQCRACGRFIWAEYWQTQTKTKT